VEVKPVAVQPLALAVPDGSAIGSARRSAVSVAERLGFSEVEAGKVALVVTELATNLVRHAGGGTVIVQGGESAGQLELVALDRGPGIANLAEALRDGYSTGGTRGEGLGAVARLADRCDVFSAPGQGTIVLATMGGSPAAGSESIQLGGISLPVAGETRCGDAWAVCRLPDRVAVLVVDGLGHGPAAADAAAEAVRVFHERAGAAPADIVADAHAALRPTRGAALGLAEIRPSAGVLGFVGVGNVSGTILREGASRNVVSHGGIVGHQCRKIQEFTYPWAPGSTLVMYSDGLQSHWQLSRYPGLIQRHPTIVSAALYRDHQRGRDDVTVVTAREAA
jgi:anti-sigma regulatory factor (Ser/Thr protein kinase)